MFSCIVLTLHVASQMKTPGASLQPSEQRANSADPLNGLMSRSPVASRAVLRFALVGLIAFVAIGFVLVTLVSRTVESRERDAAQFHAAFITRNLIAPRIATSAELDDAALASYLRKRLLEFPVIAVRVWDTDRVIASSDAQVESGAGVEAPAVVGQSLNQGQMSIVSSGGDMAEGRRVLATYVPIDSTNLVAEVVQDYRGVDESAAQLSRTIIPVTVAGLLLIYLVLLPILRRTVRSALATQNTLGVIVEAAPQAIFVSDVNGRISFANQAAERIFGWTREELIGRDLPMAPEEDGGEVQELLDQVRNGGVISGVETSRIRKDGTPILVSLSLAGLRDESGNVTRVLAMAADITERRHLEDQMRQTQKMEAIGHLAGGIAHDFNNLLSVIQNSTVFVLEDGGLPDQAREDLNEVLSATQRASALTRQLLTFSRQEVAQPEVMDINDAVRHIERLLSRTIGEDIDLQLDLFASELPIRIDPSQLDQVLLNLAVNARDAMPDGGTLTIQTGVVAVPDQVPAWAILRVSDVGMGMDAPTKEQIFDPFFTTKGKEKGTGLGLSSTYGIVTGAGGSIKVVSAPGEGTEFEIAVPIAERTREKKPQAAARPALLRHISVMLIEDEEAVRLTTERLLLRSGFQVTSYGTPEAAVTAASARARPDLLITDVVMPTMTGPQVAAELSSIWPGLRVLYVSGYPDERVDRASLTISGSAYLAKPLSGVELNAAIAKLLDVPASAPVSPSSGR